MRHHNQILILRLFVLSLLLISNGILAQKTRIRHKEDRMLGRNIDGKTINILIGNVVMYQDTSTLYCDSAMLDLELNTFDGYGNVHMLMGDSVELFGDKIYYNGETKIGEVFDNVVLIDNRATLYTNYATYNRYTKTAYYNQHGKIVDDENVMVSKLGFYYTYLDEFLFRDSVVVTTPDYVIKADTMRYNSETEIVYFLGPTTLTGKDDYMFAYRGSTDTRNGITGLKREAMVKHKQHLLTGDSIYYEKASGFGQVFKNAVLVDEEKDVIIQGNFVEYFKENGFAYATDSALAIIVDGNDSLFLHSDTLRLKFDTTNAAERLYAFRGVKFFRETLQGACDSLIYEVNDSVINMMINPVLWSDENQLTSDSIKIFITNQELDSLVLFNNAFINSQEKDTTQFNQIKGRNVIGYFSQNELVRINVDGNSETIYYVREEETQGLIGINKAIAKNMVILIKDKKPQSILYVDQPKMTLFTETGLVGEDRKLKGFIWLITKRPLNKNDIFRKD